SYVGAIEALAGTDVAAAEIPEAQLREATGVSHRLGGRALGATRRLAAARAPRMDLTRAALPDWVRPPAVLTDGWQADEARAEGRRLGLPRVRDGIAPRAAPGG